MKKIVYLLVLYLLLGSFSVAFAEDNENPEKIMDDFFLGTGMSRGELDSLGEETKAYIYADLIASGEGENIVYIEKQTLGTGFLNPGKGLQSVQDLQGINATASAFVVGNYIYVYPTYEFTTPKKPVGKDCLSVGFGDALVPVTFSGQVWYKVSLQDAWQTDWDYSGMTATETGTNYGKYQGNQLGTPDGAIYIKGCAAIHAMPGSGSIKLVVINYVHAPHLWDSFSVGVSTPIGFSVSATSGSNVYSRGWNIPLSY